MKITPRPSDSVLVGLLFIIADFRLGAAQFDIIPDVLGWLLMAGGLGGLLTMVGGSRTARLWSPARTAAWVMVALSGALALASLVLSFGMDVGEELLAGDLGFLLVSAELVLSQVVIALLGLGGQVRAGTHDAPAATLWLRIGWIIALVVAALWFFTALAAFLGTALLPNLGGLRALVHLAALASGILVGVGLAKLRNEAALD